MHIADTLVMVPIDEIKPYHRNARVNATTIDKLVELIPKVGFDVPLLLDRANVIVKGHSRWHAARRLGMERVPCLYTDADEETIKLNRIADNRVQEFSAWDHEVLGSELASLDLGFEVSPGLLDFTLDLPVFDLPEPGPVKTMPARISMRPVADLVPYARNARTHSPEQVAQIAASMVEFGFTNPVLIDGAGGIIAGHARVLAAQSLGLGRVPCIELDHLSPEQLRAYIIADNKLAENAGWDPELLKIELSELRLGGFDLALTGFDEMEVAGLLDRTEGRTDPDDVPDTPTHPVTQPGELWLLGRHRLLCGDATVATDVEHVLGDAKPHLMVTDPPYGVDYDPGWRNKAKFGDGFKHAGRALGEVTNDDRCDWRDAWALFPGDVAYIWHGGVHAGTVQASLGACRFTVRSQIIWAKSQLVISRGHYHAQHEPCFYAVRDGASGHWTGDRKQTTLWQIDKNRKSETGHSTQKPVECMRRPMENNSSPGQAVYEPFSGSGTTIIAAEVSGRAAHAIEIAPCYVDVAVKRWQEFTGEQAVLDGDGRSFDDVAAQRSPASEDADCA